MRTLLAASVFASVRFVLLMFLAEALRWLFVTALLLLRAFCAFTAFALALVLLVTALLLLVRFEVFATAFFVTDLGSDFVPFGLRLTLAVSAFATRIGAA